MMRAVVEGAAEGMSVGHAEGVAEGYTTGELDQTRCSSKPHPDFLVHCAASSVLVHRRPPASSQSSLAVAKEVVWQPGLRELAHTAQLSPLSHPDSAVSAQQRTGCSSAAPAGISSPSSQPGRLPQTSQNSE